MLFPNAVCEWTKFVYRLFETLVWHLTFNKWFNLETHFSSDIWLINLSCIIAANRETWRCCWTTNQWQNHLYNFFLLNTNPSSPIFIFINLTSAIFVVRKLKHNVIKPTRPVMINRRGIWLWIYYIAAY